MRIQLFQLVHPDTTHPETNKSFFFINLSPGSVNGGYGDWSDWGSCDCDDMTQTRTRSCDNPTPINDGFTCTEQSLGDASETRSCTATADECTSEDSDENAAHSKGEFCFLVHGIESACYACE